jgi:hypothetical protein
MPLARQETEKQLMRLKLSGESLERPLVGENKSETKVARNWTERKRALHSWHTMIKFGKVDEVLIGKVRWYETRHRLRHHSALPRPCECFGLSSQQGKRLEAFRNIGLKFCMAAWLYLPFARRI